MRIRAHWFLICSTFLSFGSVIIYRAVFLFIFTFPTHAAFELIFELPPPLPLPVA
jgi:hypothetical protein